MNPYIRQSKRNTKHKVYLSAILDVYDRRIVAYTIGDSNNNHLVFRNFDDAVAQSDRGFQYTNRMFHAKIEAAGMVQRKLGILTPFENHQSYLRAA